MLRARISRFALGSALAAMLAVGVLDTACTG